MHDPFSPFVCAGAGFLLAVLWMDLMFDVQVASIRADGPAPEPVLASITAYYRRVTTDAAPMPRCIGGVMVLTLLATVLQGAFAEGALWRRMLPVLLIGFPMTLALRRILPDAVTLGSRVGSALEQTRLARSILRGHVLCLASVLALLGIEWAFLRGLGTAP